MRGVFGLLLLGGGAALAVALGAGWKPLQALQSWANSGSNPIVPQGSEPAKALASPSSEPDKPLARTSGGKAQ